MDKNAKIFVAGHKGLVGSAIVAELEKQGYTNLLLKTRKELDLIDQKAVRDFFVNEKPEYVIDAAAKVGGILGNSTYPADFLFQNLQIQANIISSAHENDVKKLLFLGSSCIYPRDSKQPMKEEYWLTGKFEPTNEAYAIAKSAGIVMCDKYREQYGDNFISAMPTNLFGPRDNFHPQNSHLVPAMMRRLHEAKLAGAKEAVIWGTGNPRRELLYIDDMAEACVFLINNFNEAGPINVGTGEDLSIKEIAETIKSVVGFEGELIFDTSKPDGMPVKVMDVTRINNLGWIAKTSLKDGLQKMYDWFLENQDNLAER
jgi:GDP-L-fucose synthase